MPRKELPEIPLARAFQEYVAEVESWGRAEDTIREKWTSLNALARVTHRGQHTLTRNLTRGHFKDALLDLRAGASPATNDYRKRVEKKPPRTGRGKQSMAIDRATLRQFVEFLHYKEWVRPGFTAEWEIKNTASEDNPDAIRKQVVHRRIPRKEWEKVLDCATHPRERFLAACGLWWARRGSDLSFMRWGDLHTDETSDECPLGWVELFNPKKRRRVANGEPLPIGPDLRRELDRYLEWFVPRYGEPDPSWPLFAAKVIGNKVGCRSRADWPLVPDRNVGARGAGAAAKATLVAYFGPDVDLRGEGGHTFRRSGLRWYDEEGGPEAAQLLADHEHPSQTRAYAGSARIHGQLSATMQGAAPAPPPPPPPPVTRTADAEDAVVIDMFSRQRVA